MYSNFDYTGFISVYKVLLHPIYTSLCYLYLAMAKQRYTIHYTCPFLVLTNKFNTGTIKIAFSVDNSTYT